MDLGVCFPHSPDRAENELVQGDNPIIDLRTADLRGANFEGADLENVASRERVILDALDDVNLNKTQLDDANLNSIRLRNARLNGALMYDSTLVMANLQEAELRYALIVNTDLSGADLDGTDFYGAALDDADLSQASLVGANFGQAFFSGTCFVAADLRGANLAKAGALTNEQPQQAYGDEKTQIPWNLQRPEAWSKPIEEQRKGKDLPSGVPGAGREKAIHGRSAAAGDHLDHPSGPVRVIPLAILARRQSPRPGAVAMLSRDIQQGAEQHNALLCSGVCTAENPLQFP